MTPAQRKMLALLAEGSLQREILFHRSGSHGSGYRPLGALVRLGYVETSVTGTYMTGSDPTTRCRITDAGRAALATL
jgi:hypothetical protein